MKKLIFALICILSLQSTIGTMTFAKDFIYFEEPLSVPYDITYYFFNYDQFRVKNIAELHRLLDLVYKIKKDAVFIYPDAEIYEESQDVINGFVEQNAGECWSKGKVTDMGNILQLTINWKSFDYNNIPVLCSAEEVYQAVQESKTHPTYDKVYRISADYLSYEQYKENKLESIAMDVLSLYGEDISSYLLRSTYLYIGSNSNPYYIYASIGVTSDYENEETEKTEQVYGRYYDILRNYVPIPITDDMTDLEKIKILIGGVGTVFGKYEVTNILNSLKAHSVGVGQCMHYASVFKDFCDIYGIECLEVIGRTTENHEWNCIKYNDNWYMLDVVGAKLGEGFDGSVENLSLSLYNAETMKKLGYTWEEDEYPVCDSENIISAGEDIIYDLDFDEGVKRYQMFEPYYSGDPINPIMKKIYYEIYFEPETGKIYAIDDSLEMDKYAQDDDGRWVIRKETVLEIPSEIDGVKVKSIDSKLSYRKSAVDSTKKYGIGSGYQKVIIPDNIVVEDFAFARVDTNMLIVGDNVSAGYDALPFFQNKKERVSVGENFQYKGDCDFAGQGKVHKKASDYYPAYTDKEIVFYYSENKDISNDSYHPRVYFSGFGCNIKDEEPVKTLTLCKETEYVDPRLNRLNRKYVIEEGNPYYTVIDGVLYNKDVTKLISVPVGVKEINIPDTVTIIGEYAFAYCHGLTDIVIPSSVEYVETRAFFHMSGLKNIFFESHIPEGYNPQVCGNFRQVIDADPYSKIIKWNIEGKNICFDKIPTGGRLFTVFYDTCGKIMSIKEGKKVEIPIYAKKFEVYCWDNELRPITTKISQKL